MRLREQDKSNIAVSAPGGMRDDVYIWGEAVAIRAAVYPMEQSAETRVYGDSVKDMRLMLYDGNEELSVGMGVSLDGGAPAFRIVRLEAWSHTRAVLERIPEGRRM